MAADKKTKVHPFIRKIEELYDTYCSDPDIFMDLDKLKNMNVKHISFLEKEYKKISGMLESEMPCLTDILNIEASTYVKKNLYEKYIVFIQLDHNTVEFFEARDILNKQIKAHSGKLSPEKEFLAAIERIAGIIPKPVPELLLSPSEKLDKMVLSDANKSIIKGKIDKLNEMSKSDGEYHKLKEYVRKITSVPFGKYADGKVTQERLVKAKKLLDKHVMFNYDAKDEIMNYLVNDTNHCISLFGPPGTSKSTLIQKGLSEALSRPMKVISLGGKKDGHYLTGHSYTYEGAVCGRIIDILIETQVMNPIIYFDELDKITGNSINGVLTHLIDVSQNFDFHDNYFSGISFDLSKVLFVFSYNDATELDSIVSDRIKHIKVNTLSASEKVRVLKEITIPTIIEKFFKEKEYSIPEEGSSKRRKIRSATTIVIQSKKKVSISFEEECLVYLANKYNGQGMRGLIKDIEHVISRVKTLYFLEGSDKDTIVDLKYGKLNLDFGKEICITTDVYKKYFEKDIANEVYHTMYN